MEVVKGYFDYNISHEIVQSKQFSRTLKDLLDYGYKTIAVNQTINEETLDNTQKKKKKGAAKTSPDLVPPPIKFEKIDGLKILNRLTIVFSKQDEIYKIMKSKNYKLYDIVAVLPVSQNAFQYACSSIDFDIFCFDPLVSKLPFKLNRKLYKQLAEKGVHFEICYGPAIIDSSQRKNVINISHIYHSYGKSQNVIISSGAVFPHTLRSPYDIINLGLIFGLTEEQAKNSILSNGRNVFIHSVRRKLGKPLLFVENASVNDTNEGETVKEDEDEEEMDVDQPAQKKTKL